MVIINYNYKIFLLSRIWFCEGIDLIKIKSDIIRLLRFKGDLRTLNRVHTVEEVYTLVHDLTVDESALMKTLKKNVAYEIKRARNEIQEILNYNSEQLKERFDLLNDFYDVYKQFCATSGQENLIKDLKPDLIESYIAENCLILTQVTYENGKVYHAYVYDEKNAVLIYSASDFRNLKVDKQLAGRANKLLHYEDMLKFKGMGIKSYDWGNISSNVDFNGIDIFKLSFGGTMELAYNVYIAGSLKGAALILAKKILETRGR